MLEQYIPKKFCKEFVIEGFGAQLPLIMATVKGIKPVSDIWVNTKSYHKFKQVCNKYNLNYYPNGIFAVPDEQRLEKIYEKYPEYRISTTKVMGFPFDEKKLNKIKGSIHLFISQKKENLKNAIKYGWYPQIIRNKIIEKPPIDLIRFGKVLGYPDCCIEFFNKSHKPEIPIYYNRLKNTRDTPSIYCNNVLNHFSYSFIHHTCCSLSCEKTIEWAKEIEAAIAEKEPEYVNKIRNALKLPLLVWGERNSYVFNGHVKGNKIYYTDFKYSGDSRDDDKSEYFKLGNVIEVTESKINVFLNNKLVHEIDKEKEYLGFILNFN